MTQLSSQDLHPAHDGGHALQPAPHGGLQEAELRALGLDPDAVVDFSSSTNPYGPNPELLRALGGARLDRYPDPTGLRAREALAAVCQVKPAQVVLGNGAAELLWVLARCLVPPDGRALVVAPTFAEFGSAVRAQGSLLEEWRCRPEDGFALDLDQLSAHVKQRRPAALYLCSPNTPTGTALPAGELYRWAERHAELTLVLDQSFLSLSERWQDALLPLPGNVVAVRSLTKDHGVPGLRLGYALGPAPLCQRLEASRPAWTTSAFAQVAALACCRSRSFVQESRQRLLEDRLQLARGLAELGIEALPSQVNFLLARPPEVPALRARLLARHSVLVRDCASFGLPGFMRLAARPASDRARLLAALRAEVS